MYRPSQARQAGAVLYTGLVILILLTLLGLASMSGVVLQERMAGNHRVNQSAFQNAEARLRLAERDFLASALQSAAVAVTTFDLDDPSDPSSVAYWATRGPAVERERVSDLCAPSSLCSLTAGMGGNTPVVDQVLLISTAAFDRPDDHTSAVVLQSVFVP